MVEKVHTLNTDFNKWWDKEGQGLFSSLQRSAVHKIYLQGLNKTWEAKDKFMRQQDELIQAIDKAAFSTKLDRHIVTCIKKLIYDWNE